MYLHFYQTQKYLGLILLIFTWYSVHHFMIAHVKLADSLRQLRPSEMELECLKLEQTSIM